MRTRDRDEDWIEELGRRRLEALIAELTPGEGTEQSTAAAGEPAPEAFASDDDPAWPEPAGRHARRPLPARGRVGGWVGDRVPPTWRARLSRQGLQQGHVGILALVLALAVVLGGWTWVRSTGTTTTRVASPAVQPSPAPAAGPSGTAAPSVPSTPGVPAAGPLAPATGASGAPAEVVVHVAGRVERPGIVVLPAGSRVVDAVRRAGGFARGVGPRSAALNLARVLVDGEQVVVGARSRAAAPGPVTSSGDPLAGGALVSLNTADQAALESLPGVGPVTAAAILQWRSDHGPFTAVEQLLEVSGIGDAILNG